MIEFIKANNDTTMWPVRGASSRRLLILSVVSLRSHRWGVSQGIFNDYLVSIVQQTVFSGMTKNMKKEKELMKGEWNGAWQKHLVSVPEYGVENGFFDLVSQTLPFVKLHRITSKVAGPSEQVL